jgi:hypothetical protein
MAPNAAKKLKQRADTETLTFEVFDLDLDEHEQQQLAEDPRGFLTDMLEGEGQVVNDLLVAANDKFMKPDGSDSTLGVVSPTPPHPPSVWHCVSPESMKSKWITIVQ